MKLYLTLAILYALILALVQGLAMILPHDSKAAKLARQARNCLLAFIPSILGAVKKARGTDGEA